MKPSSGKRVILTFLSQLFALTILFGIIYVLTSLPIPRQFGLIFRQQVYILPFVFILVVFTFSIRQAFLKRIGYAFLIGLFFVPLSGLLNSGSSDQYVFGGTIPWSDAFTNHLNALRLLYGGVMAQSTALRPISAVFYDAILYLTNNNLHAVHIVVTFLIGLSAVLVVRKIETSFSGIVAIFVYCNAFFFIRRYIGTFMTEPYAFILGNLALYLFLKAVFEKNQGYFIFACFLLSLALNARPGPMVVLATIGSWYYFRFLKYEKRRFLTAFLALCAMIAGFGINELTARIVTDNAKLVNRQFAEFVYGMCLGGKSGYETMFMPEMVALDTSATPAADLIGLCRAALAENPNNLWISTANIFKVLIFDPIRGAFSYFDGGASVLTGALRWTLMILWTAGILLALRKRRKPIYSFFLAASLGFLLSQFIVPPFAAFRMRYHAGIISIPAIFVAIPIEFAYVRFLKKPAEKKTGENPASETVSQRPNAEVLTVLVSAAMGLLAVAAPFFINAFPIKAPKVEPIRCFENEVSLFTRIDHGAYFYMRHQENLKNEHYPNFRLAYVRQEFHNTASLEIFELTDHIVEETAIFRGIDLNNYRDALVFAPLSMIGNYEGYAQFCGNWIEPPILRDDRFFIPTSVQFEPNPDTK